MKLQKKRKKENMTCTESDFQKSVTRQNPAEDFIFKRI